MKLRLVLATIILSVISNFTAQAETLKLAVTTSFNNSGLSDILLPEIKKDTDLEVQLLIVGTGQALKLGRAGDVDAILVHSKAAEEKFISEGYGTYRREIMFNDFVLIGPSNDPAQINKSKTAAEALKAVSTTKAAFVSRGDDSGTHKKELSLWKNAGLDADNLDTAWYRAAGAGMGASLNTASGMNAYIMSDRASWLKFGNKGDLKLLFSGDPILFNQYAFLPVNPDKHSHVKADLVKKLEGWLVSPKAQKMIGEYKINGETLFTPNANPDASNG
jgi:tungstate transport system substrate-binding protein